MKKTLFKLSAVVTLVLFFVALSAVQNCGGSFSGALLPVVAFCLSCCLSVRLSPWR